jgi:hypothetical protein
MHRLWHFLTLRSVFQMNLAGDPDAVVKAPAQQVRPRDRTWTFTLPPAGDYLVGAVDDARFSVGCVHCRYVGSKCQLRWVVARGTIHGDATGATVSVVVRHGLDKIILSGLLLMLSLLFLAGWPLLLSAGDIGPVLAAGCATPALLLPLLWLFFTWLWWREVRAGQRQMMHVLEALRTG